MEDARRLMERGISPTEHQRQVLDAGEFAEPSFQPDFQPSAEFLMNQENMLRDPREIERRLAARQYIPRWAMDHYSLTRGREIEHEKIEGRAAAEKKLRKQPLVLPEYARGELEAFKLPELIAVARNYRVPMNAQTTNRRNLVEKILEFQTRPIVDEPDEEEVEIITAEGEDDVADALGQSPSTYRPAETPPAKPAPRRQAVTPEEMLEFDAQVQSEASRIAAKRKDDDIQRFGAEKYLKQAVGERSDANRAEGAGAGKDG